MIKKMQLKVVAATLACFGVLSISGCASIVSSGSQEVSFKSEPEGALIVIGGREMGRTPMTTKIDRKAGQVVSFRLDGYKTEEMPLSTTVNGWFFGNIVIGGLLGSSTDSATGAINEYSPSFYNVTLNPIKTSSTTPVNEVKTYIIANYKSIYEELNTKSGQYVNSLWTLLNIPADKQPEALEKLKKLSEENTDIIDFAKKVSEQFR